MAILSGEDGPSNMWMRPSWRQGVSRLARHRYCGTTRSTSRSTSRPVKDQLSRRGVCWKLQGLQSTSLARAAAARLTTCRRLSHTFLSSSRPSRATMEAQPGAAVPYVAFWSKQAPERAHACSWTLRARRGRRLKLLGWLESRSFGRLLAPVAMESQGMAGGWAAA